MHYLLFIIFSTSYRNDVPQMAAEFNTQQACVEAKEYFESRKWDAKYVCISKGEEK